MEDERSLRTQFRERLHIRQARDLGDDTRNAAERADAVREWRASHEAEGLEPHDFQSLNDGREFLAERIIRELASSSGGDAVLVGIGLACGLSASIWGTWAL